jgi:hypothetical protein
MTGMPVAYSFVGSEGAEGSAHKAGKCDRLGGQREEADRSLVKSVTPFIKGVCRLAGIVVRSKVVEIGFAQPLA